MVNQYNGNILFDMKSIVIRVDATVTTGAGHLIRCLAIAEQLEKFRFSVTLWGAIDLDISHHYRVIDYRIDDTLPISTELLIVDSYSEDSAQLNYYFSRVPTVVLDDENNRGIFKATAVVNPIDRNDYERINFQKCLLGFDYAILRQQFKHACRNEYSRRNRILLVMGGSDFGGLTLPICQHLSQFPTISCRLDVVIGPGCQDKEFILSFCERNGIKVYENVGNIETFMACAKSAITAGGGTVFELAYMGVPSYMIEVASNQRPAMTVLKQTGYFESGSKEDIDLLNNIVCWIEAVDKMESNIDGLCNIVDGNGAKRVAQCIYDYLMKKEG